MTTFYVLISSMEVMLSPRYVVEESFSNANISICFSIHGAQLGSKLAIYNHILLKVSSG